METNRDRIAKLLIGYLKNSLSKEQEAEFTAWLEKDDRNKALLKEFEKTSEVEARLNALAAFDENTAWQRLRQQLEGPAPVVSKAMRIRSVRLITILSAASILLLFTFSWLFFSKTLDKTLGLAQEAEHETDVRPASSGAQLIFADGETISLNTEAVTEKRNGVKLVHDGEEMHYSTETSIPDQKTKYNTLVVPKASFFRMVLADGTKVWVNAMSKLRFPVVFSPSERRVFLEGEAYFEVAHEADRPFVVDVNGDRSIKVLGTHFNVNTYNDRLYATLAEGKVEVFAGDQKSILMPGQKAYVVRDQINVRNADLKRDLAWKNGEFYFKDDNLVQIAHQLSLWYDLDIRFGSSVSTTKTYSGSIGRDVNLSEVLELLSYATKLSFEMEGQKLTISETKKMRI
ncbi:DUF4974 domain-containing protein [Sphingobacterium alkalisoli]|uniref:DUF4974 domain-containing protein n=1 Tax=Sphingobacterium alkalisoli TaxID=1874115 RepID=A0A4U0GYV7_9SPHI|nr:FecR family protein [Sphingobacterium alkalisoli]TJY64276.1 DUF4974 domain-containing protein [Sphingobacterium alkalisoli]